KSANSKGRGIIIRPLSLPPNSTASPYGVLGTRTAGSTRGAPTGPCCTMWTSRPRLPTGACSPGSKGRIPINGSGLFLIAFHQKRNYAPFPSFDWGSRPFMPPGGDLPDKTPGIYLRWHGPAARNPADPLGPGLPRGGSGARLQGKNIPNHY